MASPQDNSSDKKEVSTSKDSPDKETSNKEKTEVKEDVKKDIDTNKDTKFSSATVVKLGSLMPESTEVVDVDDVILYKNNFDINDRSHLVPYVIYMDSKFKNVIQTKKRNAMLILIMKILGCLIIALVIVFAIKSLIS